MVVSERHLHPQLKEFDILREGSPKTCISRQNPEHVIEISRRGPSSAVGGEGGRMRAASRSLSAFTTSRARRL